MTKKIKKLSNREVVEIHGKRYIVKSFLKMSPTGKPYKTATLLHYAKFLYEEKEAKE